MLKVYWFKVLGSLTQSRQQAAGGQWDVKYLNAETQEWAWTKEVMKKVLKSHVVREWVIKKFW
jgi:hypothetical protein